MIPCSFYSGNDTTPELHLSSFYRVAELLCSRSKILSPGANDSSTTCRSSVAGGVRPPFKICSPFHVLSPGCCIHPILYLKMCPSYCEILATGLTTSSLRIGVCEYGRLAPLAFHHDVWLLAAPNFSQSAVTCAVLRNIISRLGKANSPKMTSFRDAVSMAACVRFESTDWKQPD